MSAVNMGHGGRVVRVPDCQSEEPGYKSWCRLVGGSGLVLAIESKLVQFCSPYVAWVGPFYLVSIPGEVKDPTQGNGKKTCCVLTELGSHYLNSQCQNNQPNDCGHLLEEHCLMSVVYLPVLCLDATGHETSVCPVPA